MLFDPKWEVKADPFSLESLIAWLEKMPADGTYNYISNGNCLLAQYLRSSGHRRVSVDGYSYYIEGTKQRISPTFRDIAMPEISWCFWRSTYGAALERARKLLP